MSDLEKNEESAAMAALELEALKNKAKLLGVKFHPSIGYDGLLERIKEHEASDAKPEAEATGEAAPLTKSGKLKEARNKALALVRVNITCMNPAKKEWDGEIIAVGNASIPTQKKFIPFNTPDGYHIPYIMYEMLKERECPIFYNDRVKTSFGVQTVRKMRRIKEFAIQVLDPLTPTELKELARVQAAAAGME
jgi:hypothetical protein